MRCSAREPVRRFEDLRQGEQTFSQWAVQADEADLQ